MHLFGATNDRFVVKGFRRKPHSFYNPAGVVSEKAHYLEKRTAITHQQYPRQASTSQLQLRAVTRVDAERLHTLLADPRVWAHLPRGRHHTRQQTEDLVSRYVTAWEQDHLGYWVAETLDGAFAGIGGCSRKSGPAWNLYYRFRPEFQGRGLATELALQALQAAKYVNPGLPLVALLLEHNRASEAVAKKIGLRLVWRGPAVETHEMNMTRLIYADRSLSTKTIHELRRDLA